ncbi:GFA family protein [Chelatococcus sp. SYSU_G07232]|uniref:GFA family protein n=1 Tax=Chelatococcus albus TaxID=3047466 RepID=A0ABT7AGD0_9HYPH|nr:GFA family protein [Chelatococcus sp. SYSU_G07232]MDJ1158433.1 GFA family protein [Chelatococcus sp. SYSU_G07232]
MSGGCQCGAVRYAVYGEPFAPSICWCRMCQKATGGLFGAYVDVKAADLVWTRGEPGRFASSAAAERGFCASCSTPLFYKLRSAAHYAITMGSLDHPHDWPPQSQLVPENRPAFCESLASLEVVPTSAWLAQDPEGFASRQHPDHDTEVWPPR